MRTAWRMFLTGLIILGIYGETKDTPTSIYALILSFLLGVSLSLWFASWMLEKGRE